MKFRVGACALLVCLAGCTAEAPDTKFGDQRGAASTNARTAQRLPSVQAGRQAVQSVANAPDRGELMSYKNKGAASKREGAYTWYPVAISEAHALKAAVDGVMTIPSPDGSQVKVRYERHVEHPDGNWTWIGRVIGGDQKQEAILTFGEKAVFGSIPQKTGAPLNLQTRNGMLYAVQTDLSKVKNPNSRTDMMVPPAAAFHSTLMAAASKAQASQSAVETKAASAATTVDVAIGYSAGLRAVYGSQSATVTRLVNLVDVGNQAFTNSLINGALRIVNAVEVNYADNTTNKAALAELTGVDDNEAPVTIPASLTPLRNVRNESGADLAVLVRKFQTPENDGCGIAWLNGSGGVPIDPATDDDFGFAVISDGTDAGTDGNTYFCAAETLVHEIGHLMGSAHDRDNSKKKDGSQLFGRYPYSFGLKTTAANGNFYTIMAYGDNNQNFYRTFSNPLVLKCGPSNNLACGIADQADNARSLNQTIPVVASFRISIAANSERIVSQDKFGMNNDNRADLFWRNSTSSSVAYWLMNGTTVTGTRTVEPGVPNAYSQVGRGNLNGDAFVDIVWTSAGRDLWLWSGTGTSFNAQFIANYPVGWEPIAILDINGDGRSDIIFRNQSTRKVAVWLMSGTIATSIYNVSAEVPSNYTLAGTGDFNGDGRGDMLWTSSALDLWMWSSNGSDFVPTFVANYPATWRPTGTADVTGDGRTDILWRNPTTSQVAYWVMNGTTVTTTRNASPLAPNNYWLAGIGDYNGDGRADIVWTSAGRDLWAWTGNGTDFTASFVDNYPVGWSPEPSGP